MGRVQQFVRENKPLPPGCAVDENGRETTDATKVKALLPFGAHKGYGLSLIDELVGAFIGGSLPTLRSRWNQGPPDEKRHAVVLLPGDQARGARLRHLRPEAEPGGERAGGHRGHPRPRQLAGHDAARASWSTRRSCGARRRAGCSSPTRRSPSSSKLADEARAWRFSPKTPEAGADGGILLHRPPK
jgi:hypothetical protein